MVSISPVYITRNAQTTKDLLAICNTRLTDIIRAPENNPKFLYVLVKFF